MSSTAPAASFAANLAVSPNTFETDHIGGVFDVIANFWLTQIQATDTGSSLSPCYNLDEEAAQSLYACLKRRGVPDDEAGLRCSGARLGLAIAEAIRKSPLDCEARIRAILDQEVASITEALADAKRWCAESA